jgi:hypothetical protein
MDFVYKFLIGKVLYYPNFLFDLPSKIYLEDLENKKGGTKEQKLYREVLQDVLDSLNE